MSSSGDLFMKLTVKHKQRLRGKYSGEIFQYLIVLEKKLCARQLFIFQYFFVNISLFFQNHIFVQNKSLKYTW